MTTIALFDRDGTVNLDDDLYLGSTDDWRDKVELVSGVAEGIKRLNKEGIKVYIVTNQAGVALKGGEFDRLTEERMHEVNRYILELLEREGAFVMGYEACPFVDEAYVEKSKKRGREVNEKYVVPGGHRDMKPNIGMVEKVASRVGTRVGECEIVVFGDRVSDVQLGLNARGVGVLIPSGKTSTGDYAEFHELHVRGERVFVADDAEEGVRRYLDSVKDYVLK